MSLSSEQLHDVIHKALDEVDKRLANGKLDGSGRYFTEKELRSGARTGRPPAKKRSVAKKNSPRQKPAA